MKKETENECLNTIISMLGYLCVATEPASSLERKVQILDRFSLPDKSIAKICDSSPGGIRNARLRVKKVRSA